MEEVRTNEEMKKKSEEGNPMDKLHSEFGFTTPIPDCVIEAIPEIGAEGLTMFCYLMYRIYNDKRTRGEFLAWPSWKNMQIQTGLSNRKISKGLKALVKAGFLERKKRFSNSVIYRLKAPDSQFSHIERNEEITGSSLTVREQSSHSENSHNERLTNTKYLSNQEKMKLDESNNNNKVVIVDLVNFKISKQKAKKLINEFGEHRCIEGLEYCKSKSYTAGALIKLLEEGWDITKPDNEQLFLEGWTFD